MHSFKSLVFGSLLATALAKPTTQHQKKSFTQKVRRATDLTPEQLADELAKVYAKFGFPAVNGTSARKAKRGILSGTVSATPEPDNEYISPITIGSTQTANLQFDTGSADLVRIPFVQSWT